MIRLVLYKGFYNEEKYTMVLSSSFADSLFFDRG